MRYLYFDTEAGLKDPKETFNMLYDGVAGSQRGFEGPIENRNIGKFFDAMEEIGKPCQRNGQDVYELDPEKVKPVIIDDAVFALVWDAVKIIKWTGLFSRKADGLYTWLEASKDKPREAATPSDLPAKEEGS